MLVSKKQIDEWVAEAIEMVPRRVFNRLHNLVFVVDDRPTREQIKESCLKRGYILFGLYQGRKQTRERHFYSPDQVSIFRQGVRHGVKTARSVKRRVYATVWHEISHHFGSSEEGARRAEKRMFERYARLNLGNAVWKKEIRRKTKISRKRRGYKRKTKVTYRVKID